ncbi:anti-sigma factor family protein [Streptomyces avicenniae]|uniref:anti-sigma factor family protein n=1 Tax=Streptomyces avicenniae TaxID=500153 RepID=UPI000699C486|nr:zf-HC2 domain-containing protein [Streptomyces avicenniae]
MSGTGHEGFADWDAAYVLGALTPEDRHAYEAHLEECPLCRDAVGELAAMPGLLARTRPAPATDAEAEADTGSPPDDLVDRMLVRDTRWRAGRRRVRVRVAAGALAAAVALAVLAGVPSVLGTRDAPSDAVSVALEPTGATPMTVDVRLDPVAWGTRLSVECGYPEGTAWSGPGGPWSYALVVTDADGATTQVATWQAVAGRTITLDAATAVPVEDIASLSVVTAGGDDLLTAQVP